MKTTTKMSKALLGVGLVLIIVFTLVGHASAQTCVQPPAGLVSWWPFDAITGQTAPDIADTNPGTLGSTLAAEASDPTPTSAGKVAGALSFDGDDFVSFAHNANLAALGNSFSITAWVSTQNPFFSTPTSSQGIMIKDLDYSLDFESTEGKLRLFFVHEGQGRVLVGTSSMPMNTFVHVAVVFDAATGVAKIYMNGALDASGTGTPFYTPTPGLDGRLGHFLKGILDEPEFYNVALTESQIQAIVAAGSAGKCKVVSFSAKVSITLGPQSNDDAFEVKDTFTLGAGSDGINPLTEDVSIQVGTFSTTIPAGSFELDVAGIFKFEGVIDGVALEVRITPLGGDTFQFNAMGSGTNLTGTAIPPTVGLTIGDDGGSTTPVMGTAEFE